jgi:putative flippase GtrA
VTGGTGFITQIAVQEGSIALGLAGFLALAFLPIEKNIFHSSNVDNVRDAMGAALGAEAAILTNFLINNFWTFTDTLKLKQQSSFGLRLLKFNLLSLLSISLQSIAVYLGEKFIGTNFQILQFSLPTRIVILFPTIIFIVIPLNYIIYNRFIWKTQYLKHKDYEHIESKPKKS